ncbi:hypothetical protein VTO42DRAFT_2546 [Malbranchea cinnamomea]
MPLLTLHLLSIEPGTNPKQFADQLRSSRDVSFDVVVASRPRGPIVRPDFLDKQRLLNTPWNLLLLLQPRSSSSFNGPLQPLFPNVIRDEYFIYVGIPSKLLATFPARDAQLKREAATAPLTGALEEAQRKPSSQNLELSPDLLSFMNELFPKHNKPVTMLNLLHFHPGGKPQYYKYGQAFIPVAGKRGGNAKIVGNVVSPPASAPSDARGAANRPETDWWNEISIVHYPSIRHFCDMLAGEDYQEINSKYRLKALRDTFLLCTTEFDVEDEQRPKL